MDAIDLQIAIILLVKILIPRRYQEYHNPYLGSYECVCQPGYHGNGRTCIPIDACLDNDCGVNGRCINHNTHFTCDCHPGYYVNGMTTGQTGPCVDLDECQLSTVPGYESYNKCDRETTICDNIEGDYR